MIYSITKVRRLLYLVIHPQLSTILLARRAEQRTHEAPLSRRGVFESHPFEPLERQLR